MKHTALFFLLLAVILSLGYYSVDIAELFSKPEMPKVVGRDSENSGAIYLSEENINFSPMDMIDISSSDRNLIEINKEAAAICSFQLREMSRYRPETSYDFSDLSVDESLKCNDDEYVYIEKFPYVNVNGQSMFMDAVFDSNCSVVYLRYYNGSTANISQVNIEDVLTELSTMFSSLRYDLSKRDDFYAIAYNTAMSYLIDGFYFDPDTVCRLTLELMRQDIHSYGYNSELTSFWLMTSSVLTILAAEKEYIETFDDAEEDLSEYYESDIGQILLYPLEDDAVGTSRIVSDILDASDYRQMTAYTVHEDRLYVSMSINAMRLVMIYNISGEYFEGFYFTSALA